MAILINSSNKTFGMLYPMSALKILMGFATILLTANNSFGVFAARKILDNNAQSSHLTPVVPSPFQCECGYTYKGKKAYKKLESKEGDSKILLRYDTKALGKGSYSQVHHARVLQGDKNVTEGKCIALKFTILDKDKLERGHFHTLDAQEAQQNEWMLLNMFATELDASLTRHVIRLFANGEFDTSAKKYMYSLMELGIGNYAADRNRLMDEWEADNVPLTDAIVKKAIWNVVLAVRDIHQKIIHLDLKPDNLLYVRDQNGNNNKVLKAIDFGGSLRIPERNQPSTANSCLFYEETPIHTPGYQSPEHLHATRVRGHCGQKKLTTKADIWSVGVMLYELFMQRLWRQATKGEIVILGEDGFGNQRKITKFYDLSEWIGSYFLPIQIDDETDKKRMAEDWAEEFQNPVKFKNAIEFFKFLFGIRKCCPKMFHLIVATLKHDGWKRPTAIGILDYLDGKCRLAWQEQGDQLEFLPGMTVQYLRELLAKRPIKMPIRLYKKKVNEVFALLDGSEVPSWKDDKQICDVVKKELD